MTGTACVEDPGATEGDDTSGTETGDETGGEPEMTGEELYLSFCAGCHGPEATGSSFAYELRHPHDDYTRWVVRNGRTSIEFENQMMPQFTVEVLSDDELDRILAYLDEFAQPTTGEALYLDYCRNCHGLDAQGAVVGESLLEAELEDFFEKVREGEGGSNYGARTLFMPARTQAELSDAEIQAIYDYVISL